MATASDYLIAWPRLIERTNALMRAPNGPLYFVGGVIDPTRLLGSDQPTPAVFWTYGDQQVVQRNESKRGAMPSSVGARTADSGREQWMSHREKQVWVAVVAVHHDGDIRYGYEAAAQAGPILSLLDDNFLNWKPHPAYDPFALDDTSPPPDSVGGYILFPRQYFTTYGVSMPELTEYT